MISHEYRNSFFPASFSHADLSNESNNAVMLKRANAVGQPHLM